MIFHLEESRNEQHAHFAQQHPERSQRQLSRIGGWRWSSVGMVAFIAAYAYFTYLTSSGNSGLLLFIVAVIPGTLFMFLLSVNHRQHISPDMICEMVFLGASISIIAALCFEYAGRSSVVSSLRCLKSNPDSISCNTLFVIAIVITVGFVEEFSKLLPLARLKFDIRYLPHTCDWWWRLSDSAYGICLAGCASATGFASRENLKYVLSQPTFEMGMTTAILRFALAIPFHVCCTGYASARLGKHYFNLSNPDITHSLLSASTAMNTHTHTHTHPTHTHTAPSLTQSLTQPSVPPAHTHTHTHPHSHNAHTRTAAFTVGALSTAPRNTHSQPGLLDFLTILLVPTVLHGVYDSGLMLNSTHSNHEDSEPQMTWFNIVCICVSFAAYVTAIVLFLIEWRSLKKAPAVNHNPMVHNQSYVHPSDQNRNPHTDNFRQTDLDAYQYVNNSNQNVLLQVVDHPHVTNTQHMQMDNTNIHIQTHNTNTQALLYEAHYDPSGVYQRDENANIANTSANNNNKNNNTNISELVSVEMKGLSAK